MWLSLCLWTVKTYEDMTLEELDENEDEFGEEDEAAIEMYRWVEGIHWWVWCNWAIPGLVCFSGNKMSPSELSLWSSDRRWSFCSSSLAETPSHWLYTDVSPCRKQRIVEWKATQMKNVFGEVVEISGQDYIKEVNKAGDGIWVVLSLYKQG